MAGERLNLRQEGALWKAAMGYLGPVQLHQTVFDLLRTFGPEPVRSRRENLSQQWLGPDVIRTLKSAQAEAGIKVPAAGDQPDSVFTLACYSVYLAHELLHLLPTKRLPRELRGLRLEDDLGM